MREELVAGELAGGAVWSTGELAVGRVWSAELVAASSGACPADQE